MSATFDRDAARKVLDRWGLIDDYDNGDRLLDVLAECVRPVPRQSFTGEADADVAWQAYKTAEWQGWDALEPDLHEAFLAGWVARPARPSPPQVIDRDALLNLLAWALGQYRLDGSVALGTLADQVLALVVPCATVRALDGDV